MLTTSFTNGKYFSISYLITVICVIFSFFGPEFYQNVIAAGGILSFGILHGANDLKIIRKRRAKLKSTNPLNYLVLYIGVVLLGILIFYFIPGIALLAFVLVSCYHFGEQHWEGRLKFQKWSALYYFTYGAFIFLVLFAFQYQETAQVIYQISSLHLPFSFFSLSLILTSLALLIQLFIQLDSRVTIVKELIRLGLLALLFFKGTLLFGFGLYFVVWHSFPSLRSQIHYIYDTLDRSSFRNYIISALFYWVLALVGLFGTYFFLDISTGQYLSIFFSFLAAITFPHALVMERMFSIPAVE